MNSIRLTSSYPIAYTKNAGTMAYSCDTRWTEGLCPVEGLALSTLHRGPSPLSWTSSSSSDGRWDCAAKRDSSPNKPRHLCMLFGEQYSASANESPSVAPKELHTCDSREAAMTANLPPQKRESLNHTRISATSSQSSFRVRGFDERWAAGNSFIDISPALPRRKVHSQDVKHVVVALHIPFCH